MSRIALLEMDAGFDCVAPALIAQVMNLTLLHPDIQEDILFLPLTDGRRAPVREHMVRPITGVVDWRKQRRLWRELKEAVPPSTHA